MYDSVKKQDIPPVSSINKEAGPIQVSEKEPVLRPEVSAAGVETITEKPKLTEEHEKIGIRLSAESTPVSTQPKGMVTLPLTREEVSEGLKEGLGAEIDVHNQFEGIYFGKAKYFLAVLVAKILRKPLRQSA